MDDLPLFRWQPECVVLAFPVNRRVGEVRKAARSIADARTNREADAKWNRSLSTLHRRMKQAGLPDDVIGREIESFKRAVYRECVRINSKLCPRLPEDDQHQDGGAA